MGLLQCYARLAFVNLVSPVRHFFSTHTYKSLILAVELTLFRFGLCFALPRCANGVPPGFATWIPDPKLITFNSHTVAGNSIRDDAMEFVAEAA